MKATHHCSSSVYKAPHNAHALGVAILARALKFSGAVVHGPVLGDSCTPRSATRPAPVPRLSAHGIWSTTALTPPGVVLTAT